MTFDEVADELVAGCRDGREMANLGKLYADDAVSVEPADMGMGRETHGLDAIRGKHDWFAGENDITSQTVTGPLKHGQDRFAVVFDVSGRSRKTGETWDFVEVGIYTVAGGKITREEFFYGS